MTNWRPEKWENPFNRHFSLNPRAQSAEDHDHRIFEAGADAMLNALQPYLTSKLPTKEE